MILIQAFYLAKTSMTDLLALEFRYGILTATEAAAGVILGEYDLVTVNVYFYRIGAGDIHFVTDLLRNNDSSELVYVSYYTC